MAAPAAAQDLGTAMEIWSVQTDGAGFTNAWDEARDVAMDGSGNYVLVGFQDGPMYAGTDAFVRKYDYLGTLQWEVVDDRGAVGPYKISSRDAFYGVQADSADNICLVGEVSGDDTLGYDSAYYVANLSGVDGAVVWSDAFVDGGASPWQRANGVAVDGSDDVVTTGTAYRAGFINGQWVTQHYLTSTGLRDIGPLYYNTGANVYTPDEAYAVAVDSTGGFVAVGAIDGDNGAGNPIDGDRDWAVRKYDATGTLLWTDTWAGAAGLDDVAMGVAIDDNDEIIVVGYTNKGTDNGEGADYDYLVIKYDELGYAALGNRLWELTWEDAAAPGAWERWLAVDIADNGDDVIVGGTWTEGGIAAWKVAELAGADGAELSSRTWPNNGAMAEIRGIDVDVSRVAIAGYGLGATDIDAVLVVLDQDDDGDGLANSLDGCPTDPAKFEPGVCGCNDPDIDTDYDTVLDCDDVCPDLAEKWDDEGICGCDEPDTDRDYDATPDCIDNCPDDPNKIAYGICGCGLPDDDSDGDGVLGCDDACSLTPAGTPVDEHGCPLSEGTGTGTGTGTGGTDGKDTGCACTSAPDPAGALALGLAALLIRRRRTA